MSLRRIIGTCLLVSLAATPALAQLKAGATAPLFKAQASLGGKQFTFSLSEALKKGPVVVYFYPKAFTSGCTVEAHEFAEAMGKFHALGASVIGIRNDDIATLDKNTTTKNHNKKTKTTNNEQRIMTAYDAVMMGFMPYASRTS